MRSNLGTLIVLLVVFLGLSAAQAPPFCSPDLPDGFVGSDLTSVDFVGANCKNTPTTLSYDNTTPAPNVTATFLPSGLTFKDAKIRRSITASLVSGVASVEVSITLSGNVAGSFAGETVNAAIAATMTFSVEGLPAESAGLLPVAWTGVLSTTDTSSSIVFQDADLFDEVSPAILSASGDPAVPLIRLADYVTTLSGDFNINLGGLTIAHPTMSFQSVRGAFLGGVNTIAESDAHAGQINGTGEVGVLVQQTSSCVGEDCPPEIDNVVDDLAKSAALGLCDSPNRVWIRSTRVLDLFVTGTSITFRSAAATTEALYKCGAKGYVGIQLRALNSWPKSWPVAAYLEDNTTAAYMTKASSPYLGGFLWGYLKGANRTEYSFVRSDIFGIHGGGRLIIDEPLETDAVQPLITQIHEHLNTGVALADAVIDSADADWRATLTRYQGSTLYPSWHGFLQYYTQNYPGFFRITFPPVTITCPDSELPCEKTNPVMDFSFTMPALVIPKGNAYMKELDKAINTFVTKVNAKFGVSGSVSPIANASSASATLFVAYVHRLRIDGTPNNGNATFTPNTTLVTDEPTPQLYVSAALHASFSSGMFTSLNVTLVNGAASVIRAKVATSFVPSVGAMVSSDSGGNVVSDLRVAPLSQFQAPLMAAGDKLASMEFFYTLAPLSINPGATGKSTYLEQIKMLYDAFPDVSSMGSSQAAALALEQMLSTQVGATDAVFTPRVSVQSATSMELEMRYSSLQMVTVSSPQLTGFFDLSELLIPTIVQTRVLIQLKPGDEDPPVTFELKAYCNYSDFSLPVSFTMNAAVTISSTVGVKLSLPGGDSYMNMHVDSVTDLGATVHLVFTSETLGQPSTAPSFFIYGEEQVQVEPMRIYADIKNLLKLPDANLDGALKVPFYPWGDGFGDHMKYATEIDNQLPWLVGSLPSSTVPAMSGETCLADVPATIAGNFTINKRELVFCTITVDRSSYASAVNSINAGLSSCGDISRYLVAEAQPIGTEGCVRFGLFPRVTGVVYQVAISTDFWKSSWTLAPFVEFTSWDELPTIVSAVVPQVTISRVKIFKVPPGAANGLIPRAAFPVFPRITAAEYNVSISYERAATGVNASRRATTEDALSLDLLDGRGDATIRMALETRVRTLMDIPISSVCVSSNFTGTESDQTGTTVPASANQLALYVTALMRSSDSAELVTWEGVLTLTPDMGLTAALSDAVATQPEGTWLAGLLNASRKAGDKELGIADQVIVCLNLRELDDGSWIEPIEMEVLDMNSPFFGPQFIAPPNSINTAIANITIDATFSATAQAVNTSLGVLEWTTSSPVVGTSTLHVEINSGTEAGQVFLGIGRLSNAAARPKPFIGSWTLAVATDLTWSITDVLLKVDTDVIGKSDITLKGQEIRIPTTVEELMSLNDINLVPTYSSETLASLANQKKNPFCNGLSTVMRLAQGVTQLDISREQWPFMKQTSAPLFSSAVRSVVTDLAERVCKTRGLTIATFCSLAQDVSGFPMCQNSRVDSSALVVLLHFVAPDILDKGPFQFDFVKYGADEALAHVPGAVVNGLDANFDVTVKPTGTIELLMEVAQPEPSFILGQHTTFKLDITSDFVGDMSGRLGNARVSFTGTSGGLDMTMDVTLTGSFSKKKEELPPGTEVFYVTHEPKRGRSLALRDGETSLPVQVSFTGSTNFKAAMMKGLRSVCEIDVNIPEIGAYFSKVAGASVDNTVCPEGTANAINGVKDSGSPLGFWGDINMIQDVIIGKIRDFLKRILGEKLAGQIFPLIEDLAKYLMAPILEVISPKRTNKMSHSWTNTVGELQGSDYTAELAGKTGKGMGMGMGMGMGTMTRDDSSSFDVARRQAMGMGMGKGKTGFGMGKWKTKNGWKTGKNMAKGKGMGMSIGDLVPSKEEIFAYLKEIIPRLFTKLLCMVFEDMLEACPDYPPPGADPKVWALPFVYRKEWPIWDANVMLGDHGFASLKFDCTINFLIQARFLVTIEYSEAEGLDLKFGGDPELFTVEGRLYTVPGCILQGKMLIVGFQFMPNGQLSAMLTVNKNFSVNVAVTASITGDADIGFAGPIAEAITGDPDAITALPHVHAGILFTWNWALNNPDLATPQFNITNPQLCLGSYIAGIVGSIGKEVKKIIDPLQPVIGPDGFLLKKIAVAKYIIGRETNLLEILSWVAEYFCSIDECTMEGVVDAIKVAAEVYRMVSILADLGTSDPNGCGIIQMIQDFNLDFLKTEPMPEFVGKLPPKDVVFANTDLIPKREEFTSYFNKVQDGEFAFQLDIIQNPIQKLIKVMMGGRVPVASFKLPSFTIAVGAEWSFPVWPTPPIFVVIGLGAGITVDIGKIALLSDGIINAITTGDVGQLVMGLALPTKEPNGKPHIPLKAFLKIYAGAEVSIFIFKGGVTISLQLDGGLGFSSINGDEWITFAEIWNLLKFNDFNIIAALDKSLKLTAGVRIYIKACLIFKCFTIVNIEFKFVIFDEVWKGKKPPPIATPGGRVQLPGVKKGKGKGKKGRADPSAPLVSIYPNSAAGGRATTYSEDAVTTFPPIERGTPNNDVAFDGTAADPFTLHLHGMTQTVTAPSGQPFVMRMDTRSYVGIATHTITPTSITPSVHINDCTELNYDKVPPLTTMVFSDGLPCPSVIDSVDTAEFYVKGNPNGYTGKPITIKDEAFAVDFNVPTQIVTLSGKSIFGAPDVNVNIPPPVPFVTITGHPTSPTKYTITDSAAGSLVKIVAGTESDTFVTRLSDNLGTVFIDGGAQGTYANWLQFTVDAVAGNNFTVTPYASVQEHMTTGAKYTVHHSNTPRRTYYVNAVPNEPLFVSVSTLETSGLVDIHTRGEVGAVILHQLLSCEDQSEMRIYVSGPGQHLVILGDGSNTLANFGMCTVRVFATAEAGQDARIILEQGQDAKPLRHLFNVNSYSVRDPTGAYLFSVTFSGIDWIILNAGYQSEVTHQFGTPGTEVVIHFPDDLGADEQDNAAIIENWTNAVLVNGSFNNVTVGLPADPGYSRDPFEGGFAVLAIHAQVEGALIQLVSGQDQPGFLAPAQRYQLGPHCLDPLDLTFTRPTPLQTPPTANMLAELLTYNDFDPTVDYTLCHVAYLGPVHFDIKTGSSPDWFNATSPDAPVNLTFSGGDDIVIWTAASDDSFFNVDLGEGRDKLMIGLPVGGPIYAVLGEEQQVDSVDLYPGVLPNPNVATDPVTFTAEIGPIGPSGETLSLAQYHAPYDLAHIRQGPVGSVITYANTATRAPGGVVYVNAASPGEVLKVDLQTGQSYTIEACGEDTTIVMDPGTSDPDVPPAANFEITVSLPSYTQQCYILVPAVQSSESLINVNFVGTAGPNSPNFPATVQEMSAFPGTVWTSFGKTRIQSTYIDHLNLNFNVKVNLTVDGTAGSDIAITAPAGSWVSSGATRFAGNSLIVGPSLVVSGPALASGNVVISSGAQSVSLASPDGVSETIYNAGAISFDPAVTPNAVFSPWFVSQVGSAGLTAALATNINVYVNQAAAVIIDSPSVTATRVGASLVPRGLFKVVDGDLSLTEPSALATASISTPEMAVTTVSSLAYRIAVDGGHTGTIDTSFVAASTMAASCAGTVIPPPRWYFSGTATSTFAFETSACAGVLENQALLPSVRITQPSSFVTLTSTLPVDTAPFALDVAVSGDNSAYAVNFAVEGASTTRAHAISITASNATLVTDYVVTEYGVADSSLLINGRLETLSVSFGVESSASALGVSAKGSLLARSLSFNMTGELLPIDVELQASGENLPLDFLTNAVGAGGVVTVNTTIAVNSMNLTMRLAGVTSPPLISMIGTIDTNNVVFNATGDVSALDVNTLIVGNKPSVLDLYYQIEGDQTANDLVTYVKALTNEQSVHIGAQGDAIVATTTVLFEGIMHISSLNVTIDGDISPIDWNVSILADNNAADLLVHVNVVDDSSNPLVVALSANDNSLLDTNFSILGDGHQLNSIIALSGLIGVQHLSLDVVGDTAPLNFDIDMTDGVDGTLATYIGAVNTASGSAAPATNVSLNAKTNMLDLTLTLHGTSTDAAAIGFIGTISVSDVQKSVVGDMSQLVTDMRFETDNTTAMIYVSVNQNGERDLNLTTNIVRPSPFDMALTLVGDDYDQSIVYAGSMGSRTFDIDIEGIATTDVNVVSIDDHLTVNANGQSNRRPVDIDIEAKILPLVLHLAMSNDDMNLGVQGISNHTAMMTVTSPSVTITPGLYWNLESKKNADMQLNFNLIGSSSRTPVMNIAGSVTPYEGRLKVAGDIEILDSSIHIESLSALFGVDLSIIGQDNKRDVNLTVDNVKHSAMLLDVGIVGNGASPSQRVSIVGSMGQRSLDLTLLGLTPLLFNMLSRDSTLSIAANATHQSRLRQAIAPTDMAIAFAGEILPLQLTLSLENGDDLTVDVNGPQPNTLGLGVLVGSMTTRGLNYSLAGSHSALFLTLTSLRSFTRNPYVSIVGSVTPSDTDLSIYGDVKTLNSTLHVDAETAALFAADIAVIGADNNLDVNVTVDSTQPEPVALDVTVIGQASELISVLGSMGERKLNLNVNGETPMLVDVLSRDNTLDIMADGNNLGADRNTVLGLHATILPLDLSFSVTGDSLLMGMTSNAPSTSCMNITFLSSDPNKALASRLYGENNALDLSLAISSASSGTPTVTLTGGLTTTYSSLNMTGGGVTQTSIDLNVLGAPSAYSQFDLALAPLNAILRRITVQPQPITAITDSHTWLNLELALLTKKTFDLNLMDANTTLFMNTSSVVPEVFVGGSAVLLLNNTDEFSSILFPGARLRPDWPRDVFRPMLYNGTDCLQPLPDCTREGWIRTAVVDTLSCPNRTCTRTGVVLRTPFDLQCPAYGKFPKNEYVLLVNPSDAPIKSPYSKWTFYFALVMLVFAWLVPLAIWTIFGYLWWHIWAEFVVCGMLLIANAHTQPLALSLIQNFNHGVSTAFLFNCWDLSNLSIIAWTGIAASATIVALFTIEKLGNPSYKRLLQACVIAQRFFGGWLFFYFAPIALANIWTSGVGIGTRLFFPLVLVAMHILHRTVFRLRDKETHVTLWVTIPCAAIVPLVLVGWTFGLGHPDVSFSIGLVAVLIINLPHFIKAWFWRESPADHPQWPWQPAVVIASTVFGLVFVALVYARGPSPAILTFLLLWVVTAVGAAVTGRILTYLYSTGRLSNSSSGRRGPTARHTRENMRAPLLAEHDPSL